jgi:short subunit fatty acids transporter
LLFEILNMADPVSAPSCIATHYSPLLGLKLEVPAGLTAEMLKNPDAVQAAAQLGRLDLLMAILACLTIFLSVAALVGYFPFRASVVATAKSEAGKVAAQHLAEKIPDELASILRKHPELISNVIRDDPSLVLEVKDRIFGSVSTAEADQIAQAFEGENGNGDDPR